MPEPTFLDDLLEFMAVSDAALHRRRTRVAGTRGATAVAVNRTRSIAPTGEAYAANCVAVTVHDNESGRHLTSTLTADQARELLDVLATYVAVVDSIQDDLDHEAATR